MATDCIAVTHGWLGPSPPSPRIWPPQVPRFFLPRPSGDHHQGRPSASAGRSGLHLGRGSRLETHLDLRLRARVLLGAGPGLRERAATGRGSLWRSAFSAFSDSPAQRPARQSPIRRWRGRQHLPESYDSGLASWTRVVRPAPPRTGRRRRRRRSPAHGRRRQRGCSDHAVRLGELLCSRARPSPACPALMSNRWGTLPMYLPIEGRRTQGI